MPRDDRRMAARSAFLLMLAALVMAVLSAGLVLSFMMDANVTDLTEKDFAPSGTGSHGAQFSAEVGPDLPGAMAVTVTDPDDEGWAWVSIEEGDAPLEGERKVTFPFMGQYLVEGRGRINVTIAPPEGRTIEDLDVDISVSGATGLFGAFSGISLGVMCCGTWIGSLVVGCIGIYLTVIHRRSSEVRGWN